MANTDTDKTKALAQLRGAALAPWVGRQNAWREARSLGVTYTRFVNFFGMNQRKRADDFFTFLHVVRKEAQA